MTLGALFRGPPVLRFAVTVAVALGFAIATHPVAAQESRSLQDMLLAAVRLGDIGAVRSLVAAGADVAKRSNNGKTPVDLAIDLGRFDIADLLVQERRRQRDASIASSAPVSTTPSVDADIVQRSAEAAPEVVPQRVVTLPKQPVSAPPPSQSPYPAPTATLTLQSGPSSTQPTAEQLLAVAQQLTAAAQMLAAAQRSAQPISTSRDATAGRPTQAMDFDFLPRPGRKPQAVEQASLPSPNAAVRRRSIEDEADRARDTLEMGQDLPVNPAASQNVTSAEPMSPAVPPTTIRVQPGKAPSATDSDEPGNNGLIRAVKGIGGFLGIGGETGKKTEPISEAAPSQTSPSHLTPRAAAAREQAKRDRTNIPHVPARRANEYQSMLEPSSPSSLPPVKAVPVAPVVEEPLPAKSAPVSNRTAPQQVAQLPVRKNGGLNPFDPDNVPQGAVLPLTDPVVGNAPEIVRPKALALDPANDEKVALAEQDASLRETLRQSASPQRTPKPQVAVPDVPPLPDPAKAAEPTAMFERRAAQTVSAPAPKPEGGILKNLASAVGLSSSDDEMPSDAAPGASDAERLTSKRMPILSLRQPLNDVQLTLGNSVATDQRPLPRGVAEPDPCIKRSGGALVFCVVPVDWHPKVDPAFAITTYLYQGSRAIARYDGGKATHYHELFNSLAYDDVIKYFTAKYGPPTDEWKRTIAPFDQPRQPNSTMVWRSRDSRTNRITILEVRRYDDTRNVFPDMEHGAVRLYAAGAQRVFPVVTGMDLMAIDWAARSDHNADSIDPALANTIRVGR